MNFYLKEPERIHLIQIFELLQNISNFYPDKSDYENIWKSFINQNNVFSVVVLDQDINRKEENLIGFGSLHFSQKIRGGNIGFIEDIAVLENYRKKGVGKLILDSLIKKAQNKCCYKLVLECKEDTKKFYQNKGFQQSGTSMSLLL